MSNANINIPNDIVIEIFSRIPTKSLLRIRWACKYWFDLITSDHVFINKHLHHRTTTSTTTTYDDDDRIINNTSLLVFKYRSSRIYTMNFGDVVNNDQDHDVDERIVVNMDCYNLPIYDDDDDYVTFCGSCNGLILLSHGSFSLRHQSNAHTYFLWNPCTRELKELPHEPSNTYPVNDDSYVYYILGFGYDHIIDDYKVIRLTSYSSQLDDNTIDDENSEISVYTLGSNSWRTKITADPLVSEKLGGDLGLFVNGALHWMISWQWSINKIIMSFDITKEEYREVEGPNFDVPESYLVLAVLNDCLCICQKRPYDKNFVIWMMKDYGVKDSWTKLFTIYIEKVLVDTGCRPIYAMEPIKQYCNKDGGILMVFNTNIIVACDSKNNEARFIYKFKNREDPGYTFNNGTYIESLVSLNSGIYLTLAGSKTATVEKKDLLEYEVFGHIPGDQHLVKRRGANKQKK